MKLDDIRKALAELAAQVKGEILARLRSPIGINRAAKGKNTLEGSNLEKSIDVYTNEETDGLVFVIADYFSYVTGGRKHGLTPKGENVYGAIQSWVRRKNVKLGNMTENQIIWAVLGKLKGGTEKQKGKQKGKVRLKKRGEYCLPPRPFIGVDYDYSKYTDEVIPFLNDMVDKWMDDLFDKITEETDNYFNK